MKTEKERALENIKKRMDYINETEDIPCYACQGGGCPVCSGTGYLTQSVDLAQKTLDVLWSLRQDDKFYFMAYGKELLNNLLTKQDISDGDIKAWAEENSCVRYGFSKGAGIYDGDRKNTLIEGVKAYRDGLIKKGE